MAALLAFIPHPDDETYGFGGLLALAADAGWRCTVHCATRGEGGVRHDGGPTHPQAVGEVRAAELRASCRTLGVDEPELWDLPDGQLMANARLDELVASAFAEEPADLVVGLGPDGAYGHPDHLALHHAVRRAWEALPEPRPPLLYPAFPPALFIPQYEQCVASGIMGTPPYVAPGELGVLDAHYCLALPEPIRERKLAAIAAHRSQLPGGDPYRLFPDDIVAALLENERFAEACGCRRDMTRQLLAGLGGTLD